MSGERICAGCAAVLSARTLACPSCARLVHQTELEELARRAGEAEARQDFGAALEAWRRALELLPPSTRQRAAIQAKVVELSGRVESKPAKKPVPKWLASMGVVGALVWKSKFVLAFVLTKGKFVLLGLTKWKTALSMLLSLGVYWNLWGWPFALGFVLSMYVHEMGHVAALRRYGIRASAPMFIPGFGAFVRLEQHLATVIEDARVGIAGPWWGLGAALVAYGLFLATGAPIYAGIARAGAWLNLFNLVPIWQLDGGRAFASLTRKQRTLAAAGIGLAWLATGETLFVLLLGGAVYQCFRAAQTAEPDRRGLAYYLGVMGAHGALLFVQVPGVNAPGL
ncbi:MAG: site-2 protease family protein [Planctomycetes bacterium]|nr:site-2 protease family protein [Planctomycetota bacterium]